MMVALLLCMSQGLVWSKEPQQLRLKWGELGSRLTKQKVALVLPDGTHIEGKAIAVEEAGLRMKVSKTSNRSVQPKGRHLIPRPSRSVLRVTGYRKIGRLLGTTGALAIAGAIVATNYPDLYEGPVVIIVPAVVAGGMVGAAVGGYYTGKAFDKRVTEIRIEPDRP